MSGAVLNLVLGAGIAAHSLGELSAACAIYRQRQPRVPHRFLLGEVAFSVFSLAAGLRLISLGVWP